MNIKLEKLCIVIICWCKKGPPRSQTAYKEFYFRNSDFIYQINRYFGVILLLDIFSNFIQVVKLIGVFAVGGSNSEAWDLYGMASFFLFLYFTDMVIVTFAVDCIVQEVPTNSYDVINLLRTDN